MLASYREAEEQIPDSSYLKQQIAMSNPHRSP